MGGLGELIEVGKGYEEDCFAPAIMRPQRIFEYF